LRSIASRTEPGSGTEPGNAPEPGAPARSSGTVSVAQLNAGLAAQGEKVSAADAGAGALASAAIRSGAASIRVSVRPAI
jgi:hypothetical protein